MDDASRDKRSTRVTPADLGLWFMNHVSNPIVRLILRSPFHGLFSGSLMLISFRGRKSGKEYTVPVQYAQTGDMIYVVPGAPELKTWWRNLRGGAPVRLHLRGQDLNARAEVLDDTNRDATADALRTYLARFPVAASAHHVRRAPDGAFDADDLQTAAAQMVVVSVRLESHKNELPPSPAKSIKT
jgi:deazaflavin-dependent oxidoreductase (nitroreductase family)